MGIVPVHIDGKNLTVDQKKQCKGIGTELVRLVQRCEQSQIEIDCYPWSQAGYATFRKARESRLHIDYTDMPRRFRRKQNEIIENRSIQ